MCVLIEATIPTDECNRALAFRGEGCHCFSSPTQGDAEGRYKLKRTSDQNIYIIYMVFSVLQTTLAELQ